MTDKPALRAALRALRKAVRPHERARAQRLACAHLLALVSARAPKNVAAYLACGAEFDLYDALTELIGKGVQLWLPAVISRSPAQMVLRQWDGQRERLEADAHGIAAPGPVAAVRLPEQLDIVLVPGVGFAADGSRLGSGAGYYDRAFAFRLQQAAPPLLLGCGFALQRLPAVLREAHDVPMDALLDEHGVHGCTPSF